LEGWSRNPYGHFNLPPKGIITRKILAEQSIDELLDIENYMMIRTLARRRPSHLDYGCPRTLV